MKDIENKTATAILSGLHDGGRQHSELLQTWRSKSKEEQVAACRKLVYGVTVPAVQEQSGQNPDEAVNEVLAIFEALFENVEASSRIRS